MEGIWASIIVGLCTGLGAIPLLFVKKVNATFRDGLLGFAGGIMIFASSFNLLQPAMKNGGVFWVIGGVLTGTILLTIIEKSIPHIHIEQYGKDKNGDIMKKTMLLITAVVIHNIPEGFAIGVGYGSGDPNIGLNLALAIGIQNIPEGLVVASSLKEAGFSRGKILLISILTGLSESVTAIIGLIATERIENSLPFILAVTAGAMYYVVSHELIPESHCNGKEMVATYGFIFGLILMIIFKYTIGS